MSGAGKQFTIQAEETDGALVVRLTGEIDIAAAPAVRETLLRSLNTGNAPLVVDLAQVGFIDSTGLSALLAGYQRARQLEREYGVAELQPRVARLFEITSIVRVIPVHDSVVEACRQFRQNKPEPEISL